MKIKLLSIVLSLSAFAGNAYADRPYFVESMVCKGKWNKQPPGYHPSYERAGIKVISFWSVRRSDCSLAPSSSTQPEYAPIEGELKFDPTLNIGGWFGPPLKIDGDTVTAPNGIWATKLKLKVLSSKSENGVRVDTLVGRDVIFEDYYYDLSCEATVVNNPSHIENNTANCPRR